MPQAFLVRMRPTGPWRTGPASGGREQVDRLFHSDSFYGALTQVMRELDQFDEWLAATARNENGSAVRIGSCFPYMDEHLYVTPPQTVWPPVGSGKTRWKGARLVPLSLVPALLAEHPIDEEKWAVDAASECLVPVTKNGPLSGPMRPAVRYHAAVDRVTNAAVAPHHRACLEFRQRSGFWTVIVFADDEAAARWREPVRACLRLLADTGVGGGRSQGWGHFLLPDIREGQFPEMVFPVTTEEGGETAYWMLSLLSPAETDQIDWRRGHYSLVTRSGRVNGSGALKQQVRMVAEGSVLAAAEAPRGTARDVAPEGADHPVYQAGFAVAVPIPVRTAS